MTEGEADEEVDGEEDGDDVGVAEVVGVFTTDTPLFQTNFFPDLMQVYFFPLKTWVALSFVQVAPGTGFFAALETGWEMAKRAKAKIARREIDFFIRVGG